LQSELAFIDDLRARAAGAARQNAELRHGIGDDAAVLRAAANSETLITVDLLIEDVDFRLEYTPPRWLGHKALAVSLSDIAAMGGRPRFSLLSLGIPRSCGTAFWEEFFDGYFALAGEHGVTLIGGDTSSAPGGLAIDSIQLGECRRGAAVLRSGAKAGDEIYITGSIGASAAGLRLLLGGKRVSEGEDDLTQQALRKHLRPEPRVEFGRRIGEEQLAHSMIDVSDGLARDLAHICAESGVSAEIDASSVPISPEVSLVETDAEKAFELAVRGGEDFELLFTATGAKAKELVKIAGETGVVVTRIGEVIERSDSALRLRRDGKSIPFASRGFDHFAG